MSPMISAARSSGGRYGAYYENTRSLCSPTLSTLAEGTGESQSGSLRESLSCLARAIERLSYFYRTFNTSFSWTLDLNVSVYAEKSTASKSSTGKAGEEETIEAPMIILDDLGICEQRAKTILETGTATGLPGMLDGRERHRLRSLRRIAATAARLLERGGFKTLYTEVEGPLLPLFLSTRSRRILLRGRPDIVLLVETPYKQLAIVNIEYTTYTSAAYTIIYRQTMYAHTLYRLYGLPVVPALLVDAANSKEAYILFKSDEEVLETRLRTMLSRLAELAEGAPARPARSREACYTCPLPIRSTCPYWEG